MLGALAYNKSFFGVGTHFNPQQSQPDMGKFSAVGPYALGS